MYAIVSIAGQQFKVEKGKKVFVHKLPGIAGDAVSFDKVMLISADGKVNVGTPYLSEAVVVAQIVSQVRGDKVLVFKKKRRKGYQKLNGHRQYFTEILIEDIAESGAPVKTEKKKAAPPKKEAPVEVTAAVEIVEQAEKKTAPRAAAPKKVTPKTDAIEKPKKAAPLKAAEGAEKKAAARKPAAKSAAKPAAKSAAKSKK